MTVLKIELLDPKAKALLEDLVKQKLIRIQEEVPSSASLSSLLSKLRSKDADAPGEKEIAEEVDLVREKRKKGNGRKTPPSHS